MTTTTTMSRRDLAAAVGSADALFGALARIETEGWDGPTGREVLDYARTVVVARAVRSAGFTGGPEAEYAEATGWAAAWEAMTSRCIRTADSPWGVVAAAVRSAVLNERIAETYGTDARSAWRVHRFKEAQRAEVRSRRNGWSAVADPAALARPLSLTALIDAGYEPAAASGASSPQWRLPVITDLLVRHGWRRDVAHAAVLHVCDHARQNSNGHPKAHGWREMSLELGIPPWQARRVTVLLVGTESWPGLMERLDVGGEAALAGPAIDAAVRATVDESMRPPARAALTIDARTARRPAMAS
jgi:hypothetical protein